MDGDIINVDISTYHPNGFHGDCSQTFAVGSVDEKGLALIQASKECLDRGINVCGPNQRMSAIGNIIEKFAHARGYSVCDRFIGHGIGREFHYAPQVFHVRNDESTIMKPGMIFTIEPILNQGSGEVVEW